MSISARQSLVRTVAQDLDEAIPAALVRRVTSILEARLADYEVERTVRYSKAETEELLSAFLSAKRVEGRSPKTLEQYKTVLGYLFKECEVPARDMTVFNIRGFLASRKSKGTSDRTLEGYRSIFSSFFGWCEKEGLLPNNPCANLGPIKYRREVRYPLSAVDIEKLRGECSTLRNRALLEFFLASGCRVGEVVALNRRDVDLRNKECRVVGKGNKERIVYLDDVATLWLERYLDSRTDDLAPLFISRRKRRMDDTTVRLMLHKLEDEAGVEDVHPHRFRRTLATNLINRGMSLQEVATILGHESVETTMTYVYVDQLNVKNDYFKYAM